MAFREFFVAPGIKFLKFLFWILAPIVPHLKHCFGLLDYDDLTFCTKKRGKRVQNEVWYTPDFRTCLFLKKMTLRASLPLPSFYYPVTFIIPLPRLPIKTNIQPIIQFSIPFNKNSTFHNSTYYNYTFKWPTPSSSKKLCW